MHRPVLLLRLEGPLQSWGTRARWDVRDTGPEPTKSGVVGLIGCALGYPTGDSRLAELSAGIRFGVRIEHAGAILEDYHTVTDFLPSADGRFRHTGVAMGVSLRKLQNDPDAKPATIISPRFYLEDAAFLAGLEERQGHAGILKECATALQDPAWPLFLGRKACVATRPIFESYSESYRDLEEALSQHPWSWLGAEAKLRDENGIESKLRILVEPDLDDGATTLRQDALQAGGLRQFGFRPEKQLAPIDRPTVPEGNSLGEGR